MWIDDDKDKKVRHHSWTLYIGGGGDTAPKSFFVKMELH